MKVIVEDVAKKKIEGAKSDSVYCFLQMCRSWGGTSIEPTVLVGQPNKLSEFNSFHDNGITVFVHKDTPCPSGTLTITTGMFLWFEKLMVEGMLE